MSQIRDITIEGFRSIKSVDLELRPLNIMIGANGSGKSNFLGAIELFRTAICISENPATYAQRSGGASRLLHFGPKVTQKIKLAVSLSGSSGTFRAEWFHAANDTFTWTQPFDEIKPPPEFEPTFDPDHYGPAYDYKFSYLASVVGDWKKFHFHDTGSLSPIKQTADLHDNRALRADGSNLAAYLNLLAKKHTQSYNFILSTIKQANPFIEDFILKPQRLNEQKIQLEWRQKGSDAYFDVHSFSDGTLRFISLATLLLQPESLRPSLILLDEPELGLHPYAIHLLAAMLELASADSQVIVATQSPILLDYFKPEDVLVAERVDGATEFHRLDSARLASWLEEYSLGELWQKNEFGGQPMPETGNGSSRQ